ncbi:hypothetical protein [Phenylobacterium sp. J367]|uniref:hypothetical protein n=1 Tax=Phenylobacterium sp. J367 TaxID=2898435 RepID=UPI002151874A|nr:hypothetical protein [Phenylobacterium sp. J367]MCR5879095.1 hypothetical protein [Phenylobacterium sp. J367]
MAEAAKLKEGQSETNVSQNINLAGILNAAARHDDALATLEAMGPKPNLSDYGHMWLAAERVCAHYGRKQPQAGAEALKFTADHASDNETARAKALLCAGDADALAARYIVRLKSADDRDSALFELSRFRRAAHTPFDDAISRTFDQVRERADVKAAVAQVGQTGTFPIWGGALIDFD